MGEEILCDLEVLDYSDSEDAIKTHPKWPDICRHLQIDFYSVSDSGDRIEKGRAFIDFVELKEKLGSFLT